MTKEMYILALQRIAEMYPHAYAEFDSMDAWIEYKINTLEKDGWTSKKAGDDYAATYRQAYSTRPK